MEKELNKFKLVKSEFNEIQNDKLYCGSVKAYFSTYGTINLRPDRMIKGCFDSEIQRWKNGDKLPRFFSNHWGTIGVVTSVWDDDFGAAFEAKYINTQKGKDAYIEAKTGAVDEYSFAFYATEYDYVQDNDIYVRNVLKVEGIDEISQVIWGMDPLTKPIEVNSDLTIRKAEHALKNAGFSNKQAKQILSQGFKSSIDRDDTEEQREADELNALEWVENFNKLNNLLKGK